MATWIPCLYYFGQEARTMTRLLSTKRRPKHKVPAPLKILAVRRQKRSNSHQLLPASLLLKNCQFRRSSLFFFFFKKKKKKKLNVPFLKKEEQSLNGPVLQEIRMYKAFYCKKQQSLNSLPYLYELSV